MKEEPEINTISSEIAKLHDEYDNEANLGQPPGGGVSELGYIKNAADFITELKSKVLDNPYYFPDKMDKVSEEALIKKMEDLDSLYNTAKDIITNKKYYREQAKPEKALDKLVEGLHEKANAYLKQAQLLDPEIKRFSPGRIRGQKKYYEAIAFAHTKHSDFVSFVYPSAPEEAFQIGGSGKFGDTQFHIKQEELEKRKELLREFKNMSFVKAHANAHAFLGSVTTFALTHKGPKKTGLETKLTDAYDAVQELELEMVPSTSTSTSTKKNS